MLLTQNKPTEEVLESLGARTGRIDLCTPNVLNLCRPQIKAAAALGGDVALLNCAGTYFSLVLIRDDSLIFFRCKSYSMGDAGPATPNGLLGREIASSFSYYEEKLAGTGVGTLLVRSTETPFETLAAQLQGLPVQRVEPIDLASAFRAATGGDVESGLAQRIAPAVGAAVGQG